MYKGEESLEPQQIGRIDIPLVVKGPLQRITPEMLPSLGIPTDPNLDSFSASRNKAICEDFRIAHYVPLKSNLVLVSACNSYCTVKMTVSQVQKYPKTMFVGMFEQSIKYQLMWRKNASWQHPLQVDTDPSEFPGVEFDAKIDTRPRKKKGTTKVPHYCSSTTQIPGFSTAVTMTNVDVDGKINDGRDDGSWDDAEEFGDDDDEDDANNGSISRRSASVAKIEASDNMFGGFVRWSLRAVSYEGRDEAGEIYLCSTAVAASSDKRRFWAVLVDSVLYLFGHSSGNIEFNHKEEHFMPQCYVSCGNDGVIKIKSSSLFFLLGATPNASQNWYKKLYINSHSNIHKPWNENIPQTH